MVNEDLFQCYLGMRNEYIDQSEFLRRMEVGIYDQEEYEQALAWVKANCQEGPDVNPPEWRASREQKDKDWEFVVKMTLIARDLMVGNPKLDELGFGEEALGRNALAAGFQGQRQWTDHFPNGDFMESILNSSFDWNGLRQPFIMATENDSLNGICMTFGHLLTNTAQVFADVRTYWSPQAIERVTGHKLTGRAADGVIHLINSGSAALDGSGEQSRDGQPVIKPFWEITEDEVKKCLAATPWRPANRGYFRGGGFLPTSNPGQYAGYAYALERCQRFRPVLQIAEDILWICRIKCIRFSMIALIPPVYNLVRTKHHR